MTRKPYSLQGRLALLVLGMLAAVWTATAAIVWFDARHEVEEILDSHLAQAAAFVVAQYQHDRPASEVQVDMLSLHRYAYKTTIQVFQDGRLVLRSANAPTTPLVADGGATGFQTVLIDNARWRVFAVHEPATGLQVYVGEQEKSRNAILWAVLRSTLWPLVLALPLLVLAVWWAVHRGLRPLRGLGRTLLERRPDALDRVQVDDAPAEMVPMVDALNALFQRIETLLESERRFTADAAHELRTPIAAIRAHAQVALQETDDALRRHALQHTIDGCDRATRLAQQLLTLSRLEANAVLDEKQVDLQALARRELAEAAPRALEKHQALELQDGPPCRIYGDEALLAVLVRNLVDNAIRYSPAGARILVHLTQDAAQTRLSVEDSGPGLPAEDLARLGERFFRPLGTTESGSGLGWSIVRRIAAAHRMVVEVERSTRLGGLAIHAVAPSQDKAFATN
jgi:two-component system sensor histidine kinase QseC